MIKLKPEHVGTRVLLSDGEIGLVTSQVRYEDKTTSFWVEGGDFVLQFSDDGKVKAESNLHVTLLLDAPNPLHVPVPEWCGDVILWFHEEPEQILDWADFQDRRRSSHVQPSLGWSPAPGQLPPKNNEEIK